MKGMKTEPNNPANGGKTGALPTKPTNTSTQPVLHNPMNAPASPKKSNLVDTTPRKQAPSPVTEKPDLHNR